MSDQLQFDVCPETGIGCVMLSGDSGDLKIDLMPDESENLVALVKAGNLEEAKALLVSVESKAESVVDKAALEALSREVG